MKRPKGPFPPQPSLSGPRLVVRPFTFDDAPAVQELAGAPEVASTTLTIPHPYEDGLAEAWIGTHAPSYADGVAATFAVVERDRGRLVGAVGLMIERAHARAELGYWIGVPFWNRGYATEAAVVVIAFGFETLGLNRIFAHHFVRNPASGKVMLKAGMKFEGRLRQHVAKGGGFEDLELYGMVREDWRASPSF